MNEFKLDGPRPRMASIKLESMNRIIDLLNYDLEHGEFESDEEFQMVADLLFECRQAVMDNFTVAKKQ